MSYLCSYQTLSIAHDLSNCHQIKIQRVWFSELFSWRCCHKSKIPISSPQWFQLTFNGHYFHCKKIKTQVKKWIESDANLNPAAKNRILFIMNWYMFKHVAHYNQVHIEMDWPQAVDVFYLFYSRTDDPFRLESCKKVSNACSMYPLSRCRVWATRNHKCFSNVYIQKWMEKASRVMT